MHKGIFLKTVGCTVGVVGAGDLLEQVGGCLELIYIYIYIFIYIYIAFVSIQILIIELFVALIFNLYIRVFTPLPTLTLPD